MKKARLNPFRLLAVVLVATGLFASSMSAATPAEDAVLAPIKAMFAGMTQRDAPAIVAQAIPGAVMVLMRDGKPTQMTVEAFAARVSRPGTTHTEERIGDPLIRIDNDLAVVWASFSFLIDGKVDHCGTDLINLVRVDGKWLIAGIGDTGRKDCPAKQ